MEEMIKYGLIESTPFIGDGVFGASEKPILREDGDYRSYIFDFEKQKNPFETFECVTQSNLNSDQVVLNVKYGIKTQLSKRYTAKMSGTIPGVGNTFINVAQSKVLHGVVEENFYPRVTTTIEDYFKTVDKKTINRGNLVKNSYEYSSSWVGWNGVSHKAIYEAMPFGPVQISIRAKYWDKPNNGKWYDYYDENTNHAVLVVYVEKIGDDAYLLYIYDSYDPFIKILSPQYYVRSAMQHYVDFSGKINPFYAMSLFIGEFGRRPKVKSGEFIKYLKTRQILEQVTF